MDALCIFLKLVWPINYYILNYYTLFIVKCTIIETRDYGVVSVIEYYDCASGHLGKAM